VTKSKRTKWEGNVGEREDKCLLGKLREDNYLKRLGVDDRVLN
jgi:hypothetical protein